MASSVVEMMMAVLLALLGAPCLLFLGVGLWVTCRTFFTVDIPVGISHPKKLWLLNFLFQLMVALVSSESYLSPRWEGEGESWQSRAEASS